MGLPNNLGRLSAGLTADASLNIGVGVTPSGTYKFQVNGALGGTSAVFSSTLQTTNIGIGAAANSTQLIYGTMSTTNTILELNNTNASGYGAYIRAAPAGSSSIYILRLVDQAGTNKFSFYGDGSSSFSGAITSTLSSGIFLNNGSAGTNASQIRINNTSGDARFGIESSTGGTIQVGTSPYAVVLGNQANNALQFTTNGTARMTILGTGNVGIGTTSPSYPLDVVKAGVNNIRVYNSANNSDSYFQAQNTGGTALFGINATGAYIYTPDALSIVFHTTNIPRMTIASGGNVLIGTTTDNSFKLQVLASGAPMMSLGTSSATGGYLEVRYNTSSVNGYLGAGNQLVTGGAVADMALTSNTGNVLFATGGGTERMRITSGGNVLIGGTTDNGYRLDVRGGQTIFNTTSAAVVAMQRLSTDGQILQFYKDSTLVGSISTNSNSLPSDFNFKKNISNLELGLNLVTKLRAVSYNHKIDDEGAALSTGFIAQEMEKSLTELGVKENSYYILQHKEIEDKKESQYWLDYTKIIPVLVKAIQEQQEQIKELQSQINK